MGPDSDFYKTTMPDSRKADFHLGCLDGSVVRHLNRQSKPVHSFYEEMSYM